MAVPIRGGRGASNSGGFNLRSFFSHRIFISALFSLLFIATVSVIFTTNPSTPHHDSALPTTGIRRTFLSSNPLKIRLDLIYKQASDHITLVNAYAAYARKLKLEMSKKLKMFDDLAQNLSDIQTNPSYRGALFDSTSPLDEDVLRQFEKEVKDKVKTARMMIVESKENYDNQLKIQKLKDTVWFKMRPMERGAHIEIKAVGDFRFLNSSYVPLLKQQDLPSSENRGDKPKDTFVLNHVRFYLPDMFPKLKKIVFLEDDVVVQKDITGLWKIDLEGRVNGAVEICFGSFHRLGHYLNFSHPLIKEKLNPKACAWSFGMNVLDLDAWRSEKCTEEYNYWQNLNEDGSLWSGGPLPPGLITFYSKTNPLDRSWHVLGLGYNPSISMDAINKAAVIHYNGNMKPWLDIAMNQYKGFWTKYVDTEMEFVQMCNFGL
ncbi:LOW QUALITY PROTEIN: probable galacturonosyltransferase 9 [Cucurbita maxima]|uniref:Hexosyltransferase n=1 Tax=Cucurbita maxima TaxID=3661 RepID=A0A6J1KCL1_CUCMA|nr:LOW QUALITY PROTEIN: probable galacturonosyltransferase 9 [Cucurbita maxima]